MASSTISQSNSQNTSLDPTQNSASVFYLHPSDHANAKLVSNLFDGNGYCDWRRSIIISLTAKKKMPFVDGTLPKPAATDANLQAWKQCNNIVLGWLNASLDCTTTRSVMYFSTAQEISHDLEERFGQSSLSQVYSLQSDLAKITHQRGQHISEYFTSMKMLWDEIGRLTPLPTCTCTGCSCDLTKP